MLKCRAVCVIIGLLKFDCVYSMMALFFVKSGLTPDLIPVPPYNATVVIYSEFNVFVQGGNRINGSVVKSIPMVYWETDPKRLYTLMLLDADPPTRKYPTMRAVNHWLVVNIPGCDLSKGDTLSDYFPPAPLSGLGEHRFAFLVYQQSYKAAIHKNDLHESPTGRVRFSPVDYAQKNELGNPVAGNFFLGISELPNDEGDYKDLEGEQAYMDYLVSNKIMHAL